MRTIKFRAWNHTNKTMVPLDPLQWPLKAVESDPTWTVMQFTGLFDKNGKEIFEGDILNVFPGMEYDNQDAYKAVVEFSDMAVAFLLKEDHGGGSSISTSMNPVENSFEVLGNVHQNKELIK